MNKIRAEKNREKSAWSNLGEENDNLEYGMQHPHS